MAGKSYKYVSREASIGDAIAAFFSEIEELGGEAREIVDSASENLANTSRIQTFGETADVLEAIQEVDSPFDSVTVDSDAGKLWASSTTLSTAVPRAKGRAISRAVRCENACATGRAGIDALRAWCDAQEAALATSAQDDDTEGVSEGALALVKTMRDEREIFIGEIREYIDEIEPLIDEAEAVEFPGKYG